MITVDAQTILDGCNLEYICGDASRLCEGCTIDSRQVTQNSIFVAFKGERVDGNAYVASAIEAGASLCVVTDVPDEATIKAAQESGCVLARCASDDAETFMGELGHLWRSLNPQWKVIGVTGSVGKTTTKELCAAALSTVAKVNYTKGNFNNLIGAPLTILATDADTEIVVVEMGMNHFDELSRISKMANPDVAIITNVGTAHIGNLGSREGIARAKAEILDGMNPSDTPSTAGVSSRLILNGKDPFTNFIADEFAKPHGVEVIRINDKASEGSFYTTDVRLNEQGCAEFVLHRAGEKTCGTQVSMSIPGKAVVDDVLQALCCVEALGYPLEMALKGMCVMKPTRMRLEIETAPGKPRVINDTYNASPSSMAEALDVLSAMACEGRRIAVLGPMGEMGEHSVKLHGLVGAYAAAKQLDLLCVIGDELAQEIADGARNVGMSEDKIVLFDSVDAALSALADVFEPEDVILVKASRAQELENFAKGVLS